MQLKNIGILKRKFGKKIFQPFQIVFRDSEIQVRQKVVFADWLNQFIRKKSLVVMVDSWPLK